MSNNEVAVQQPNNQIAVPADLAALFAGVKPNLVNTERVNTLRISGKVWKVELEGEVKKLTTVVEGEEIPVPMYKVIILNQNPKRARALFEGAYDESNSSGPVCWSSDSVRPDADVQHPKALSCEQCSEAQKKTKFDESNPDKVIEYTPCKFNKRIAVIQHDRPEMPVLRLQLAITSLWEPKDTAKNKESQGWFAFDAYCRHLSTRGIPYTAACRTIMKFDPDSNSPKVLFKFDGLIDTQTASKIVPRIESDEVMKCLGLFKKGGDGAQPVAHIAAPKPTAPVESVQEPEASKPVQETVVFTEPEQAAEVEQPKPEPKVEKPKATKSKPVQVIETEDLGDALSLAWD